jgi:exopolysaccharide biosynthesis polyprenyl glycosylphosphotransferase
MALVRVEMPRFSGPARIVKRLLDVIGSVLCLTLFAIPLLIVALAIKIDSPGPVFFRQVRVRAVGGATFRCWKLRTMVVDADRQRGELRDRHGGESVTFKMPADPRITRVGRFLRRYSIDEVPQLFNVLRGQMSLVGPRPHPLDDVERYDDVATRRLLAKPGMTGLWQVSGRSDLPWRDAVMLDLYYVENWSISLDTVIVARTLKAVLAGKGAY